MKHTLALTAVALMLVSTTVIAQAAEPAQPTVKQTRFEKIDTDKDGFVSADELLASYKTTAEKRMSKSDKDKDGKLSSTEFSKPKKSAVAK